MDIDESAINQINLNLNFLSSNISSRINPLHLPVQQLNVYNITGKEVAFDLNDDLLINDINNNNNNIDNIIEISLKLIIHNNENNNNNNNDNNNNNNNDNNNNDNNNKIMKMVINIREIEIQMKIIVNKKEKRINNVKFIISNQIKKYDE